MPSVHAIVLAAGKGTRMKSDLAKVLHRAGGRPLIGWVLDALTQADLGRTMVVVGHQAEAVAAALPSGVESIVQEPQHGTGHAVQVALEALADVGPDDTILVAYGDMPLVSVGLYRRLAERPQGTPARLVTVDPGPAGFGRIVRDDAGSLGGIVEEGDCTPEQYGITERNAGLYAFAARPLREAIALLHGDNAQGELYLTDVIATLARDGPVETIRSGIDELTGVNSHSDLARVQTVLRGRINQDLMDSGVVMVDPDRTYIDASVEVEPGVAIYPGTHLEGETKIGEGAEIGPDTRIVDSSIGAGATVTYSVVREAKIGPGANVGPYASLRPGTVMGANSKAGTFVETKNTTIGDDAKVPHLSYMGDAEIGEGANVGAGSITCNYDGYDKFPTVIGKDAFIGSDTMLVAPVKIGDGAVTGAGSLITSDVEPGALAVERSPQRDVPGYADKRAARKAKDAQEGN